MQTIPLKYRHIQLSYSAILFQYFEATLFHKSLKLFCANFSSWRFQSLLNLKITWVGILLMSLFEIRYNFSLKLCVELMTSLLTLFFNILYISATWSSAGSSPVSLPQMVRGISSPNFQNGPFWTAGYGWHVPKAQWKQTCCCTLHVSNKHLFS